MLFFIIPSLTSLFIIVVVVSYYDDFVSFEFSSFFLILLFNFVSIISSLFSFSFSSFIFKNSLLICFPISVIKLFHFFYLIENHLYFQLTVLPGLNSHIFFSLIIFIIFVIPLFNCFLVFSFLLVFSLISLTISLTLIIIFSIFIPLSGSLSQYLDFKGLIS